MLTRLLSLWRSSLVLRTVTTTVLLTSVVVAAVTVLLLNQVTAGLLEAKERSSVAEAAAGREQAENIFEAADSAAEPERLIDAVMAALAQRAGSPPLYEIVLLQAPGSAVAGPERATNLVSTTSVPAVLQESIRNDGSLSWTPTTVRYLDGALQPGLAVGSAVNIPGIGTYQLVYLFPYTDQASTLTLVQSAVLVSGLLLVGLVALAAWLVARQVALPVREASRAAVRLSDGDLEQRVPVRGEDEMARLADSFNTMARNLEKQITQLETLSRVQRRFVSDVSHELRTPLTTIRMATDVLHDRRDRVDDGTARAIELLANQVDRFERLLGDLLEISRIDAGAIELDLEDCDLGELSAALVSQHEALATDRGVRLRLQISGEDLVVLADPRRIQRIIRNLLSNAIEYAERQPVDVTVRGNSSAVAIAVRDHGTGIDVADQERVFDRFWRADTSRARTLGGTGLGLAIAKEDATLHRGTLTVSSGPGQGSQFVLTLPRSQNRDISQLPITEVDRSAGTNPHAPRLMAETGSQDSVPEGTSGVGGAR